MDGVRLGELLCKILNPQGQPIYASLLFVVLLVSLLYCGSLLGLARVLATIYGR